MGQEAQRAAAQKEDEGTKWGKLDRILAVNPQFSRYFNIDDITRSNGRFEHSTGHSQTSFYVNCNALVTHDTQEPTAESEGSTSVVSYIFDQRGYLQRVGQEAFVIPKKPAEPKMGNMDPELYKKVHEDYQMLVETLRFERRRIEGEASRRFHNLIDITEGMGHEHCDLMERLDDGSTVLHAKGDSYLMLPSYDRMDVASMSTFYNGLIAAMSEVRLLQKDLSHPIDKQAAHLALLALASNFEKLLPVYAHPDTGWTE